jgi:hypothetical protein
MISAITAIFDPEERSKRQRERELSKMGNELVLYVKERQKAIAVLLLGGKRLAFALPGTKRFEYLSALKGALVVGTYDLSVVTPQKWDAEAARMVSDLDTALMEYHEGRFTHPPGEPGEPRGKP